MPGGTKCLSSGRKRNKNEAVVDGITDSPKGRVGEVGRPKTQQISKTKGSSAAWCKEELKAKVRKHPVLSTQIQNREEKGKEQEGEKKKKNLEITIQGKNLNYREGQDNLMGAE